MKKGILVLFVAGTLFAVTSCGAGNAKEAATEICKCYEEVLSDQEAAGNATNTEEMFAATERMQQSAEKANECQLKWNEKYNGKVDIEAFKKELKAQNEAVYKLVSDRGLFK